MVVPMNQIDSIYGDISFIYTQLAAAHAGYPIIPLTFGKKTMKITAIA
jgi:hypothetical protein